VQQIADQLDQRIEDLQPVIETTAAKYFEQLKALPTRAFEEQLREALESELRQILVALNEEGLALLDEGYNSIVTSFEQKAGEAARFIEQMVDELFGVQYNVETKSLTLSKRSDYRIFFSQSGTLFAYSNAIARLHPKAKSKTTARAMERFHEEITNHQNNMLYNYRYKMQESLRDLHRQYRTDIETMYGELDALLQRARSDHASEAQGFIQIRTRLEQIMRELEGV
jgi:hypothetical protein